MTDWVTELQRRIDDAIYRQLAAQSLTVWPGRAVFTPDRTTPTKEAPMGPNDYYAYPQPRSVLDMLGFAHHTLVTEPLRQKAKTSERIVRELDVQAGDRIRLTESVPAEPFSRPDGRRKAKKDAAVLEGKVLETKEKDDRLLVRVAGFDHTGGNAGGQHVWFPLADYVVEVLHKSYRWTDEDRLLAAVLGYGEHSWEIMTDDSRDRLRQQHVGRLDKIRRVLGVDGGVE